MSHRALASLLGALIVAAMPMTAVARVPQLPAPAVAYIDVASTTWASDLGLSSVDGVAFDTASQTLVLTGRDAARRGLVQSMTVYARLLASTPLPAGTPVAPATAFDAVHHRLMTAATTATLHSVAMSGGRLSSGARDSTSAVHGGRTLDASALRSMPRERASFCPPMDLSTVAGSSSPVSGPFRVRASPCAASRCAPTGICSASASSVADSTSSTPPGRW